MQRQEAEMLENEVKDEYIKQEEAKKLEAEAIEKEKAEKSAEAKLNKQKKVTDDDDRVKRQRPGTTNNSVYLY